MKKQIAACFLSMILFFSLAGNTLAAVSGQAGSSSIRVSLQELAPGYYLGSVWDNDELLTFFSYTVGNDGKMETVVDVGKVLRGNDNLQVGISGANAGVEDIHLNVAVSSEPTDNNNTGSGGYDSGDSGDSYAIIWSNNLTGGRVSVQPSKAVAGATVNVTVVPDAGYLLDTIKITDKNGNVVKINNIRGQRYMFTMPNSAVNIFASFRQQTVYSGTFYSLPFTDVKIGDWYYEAVRYVFAQALMNGEAQTIFNPNGNMERAMLVVALHRLDNEPKLSMTSRFKDVVNNQWYTAAVIWADVSGIVNGYENSRFAPMQNITREEIATILYRFAQFKGYDVIAKGSVSGFADGYKVSAYAQEAMQWAVGAGIIQGNENNTLNPAGSATRAEVAAMLMRFNEKIAY